MNQQNDNKSGNLTPHHGLASDGDRKKLLDQTGCVLYLTGLSGSGKSTIASLVEKKLIDSGHLAYILDGDNIRFGLNSDLGFSPEDRTENIRRIAEVSALFAKAGVIAITAFISPYRQGRKLARDRVGSGRFIEVFIDTPVEECRRRDPKGLYLKADAGEIEMFTGVTAPYEEPENPELHIKTMNSTAEESADTIIDYLTTSGILAGSIQENDQ